MTTATPRYYRKVIRITAEDSPNVKYALAEIAAGKKPSGKVVIPGVLSWQEYCKKRRRLDPKEQAVSLDAIFYKGKEVLLFPKEMMDAAIERAKLISQKRLGKAMGVDAAEGGDNTCWTIVDHFGLVFQKSVKTADTSDIPGITIGLMREYGIDAECVLFDRGGGGKQHADVLRRRGYAVRTVGFGEKVSRTDRSYTYSSTVISVKKKVDDAESRYVYKNRRAELYGLLSIAIDEGFAVPGEYTEVIRQLRLIPKNYDNEGRLYLLPKDKPTPDYKGMTMKQIIGHSPDEADSFALANYIRVKPIRSMSAGAAG